MPVPIIDLFAGPGGLGEGFSSLRDQKKQAFFATELANRLPWQLSGHSADDVLAQWGKEVNTIEALRHSFALLKILDQGLWHDIDLEFDQIADLQARYFGDMAQSASDSTVIPPDPHAAANEFRAITHRILQAVYEHQRDERPS